MELIMTLCIALIGAIIATKLKIPASYMIGSLFSVVFFSIATGRASMPTSVKPLVQIVTGAYIGAGISKANIIGMRRILKPIAYSLTSIIIVMMFSAYMLYKVFGFDLPTALLSSVPGGISDITLLSYEFNADITTVALIQTMRLFFVLAVFPILIQRITTKNKVYDEQLKAYEKPSSITDCTITLIIGSIFGIIGYLLKVPAGPLSFSLFATAFYNIKTDKAYVPVSMRKGVQLLSGSLIGCSITMASVVQFPKLIAPICFIMVVYFGANFLISTILSKKTHVDLATAMFSTAPAGASDMVLIAMDMEMDVDRTTIVLMQIARLVLVVTVIPNLIKLVINVLA